MEVLLGIHRVWDVVDPDSNDAKKNNIVKGLLFQSILKDLILQIGNLKTRKEMWEALKTCNLGADRVKEAGCQTLITEFENQKMSDNDSIDAYAVKLSGIDSKSATFGEYVVGRLKQQGSRMWTDYSNRNSDSSRGRGHGSYSRGRGRGRGQGHGRGNSQNQDRNRDYEANLSETHEGDVNHEEGTFFMMNHIQETIFMNEEKYTPPKNESNTNEDDVWLLSAIEVTVADMDDTTAGYDYYC
nr:uncharacterized protein [Tanacetum cinerariifolium]